MSKDIPIIFSAPMVRALLEGRKTMTRRLAWRDAHFGLQDYASEQLEDMELRGWDVIGEGNDGLFRVYKPTAWQNVKGGDRLWVRENWKPVHSGDPSWGARYMADVGADQTVWRPSIHMPRWASRLTLVVTGVKVEPLWNISERDCEAEGVVFETADPPFWYVPGILPHSLTAVGIEERGDLMPHAVQSFRKLWIHLHGNDGWETNPFVVAISFRVIKANIDAPEARLTA